jgi:hypothetical protein
MHCHFEPVLTPVRQGKWGREGVGLWPGAAFTVMLTTRKPDPGHMISPVIVLYGLAGAFGNLDFPEGNVL